MKIQNTTKVVSLAAAAGMGFALNAGANSLDLTLANSSGTIAGTGGTAFFQQIDPQSTGTGVIDSFLRVQSNTAEDGFNTSSRPLGMDQGTDPNFTRTLLLSAVPIVVNPAGAPAGSYYQFLLDINESSGGVNPLIVLDSLRLYVNASDPFNSGNSGATDVAGLEAVTGPVDWAFDIDDRIQLDYSLNSGSGSGDMFAYIPVGALGAAGANTVITLYSHFGTLDQDGVGGLPALGAGYDTSDGFEEWSVLRGATPPVPEPHEYAMLGLGFAGLVGGWSRLRKKQAVA